MVLATVRRVLVGTTMAAVAVAGCGGGAATRTVSAAMVGAAPGFSPSTITVDKGDKVALTVGNDTAKTHGFSVEGYGIAKEVAPGSPLKVTFTASKEGVYKVFCQLHPAHQTATLVVR